MIGRAVSRGAGSSHAGERLGARHQPRLPVKGEEGQAPLNAEGRKLVARSIAEDCGWPTTEAMRAGVAEVLGR